MNIEEKGLEEKKVPTFSSQNKRQKNAKIGFNSGSVDEAEE